MILNGKPVAEKIEEEIMKKLSSQKTSPCLSVILVGNNLASKTYIRVKQEACKKVGITFQLHSLEESVSEKEILALIDKLNLEKKVNGILVQLPLPPHLSQERVIERLDPKKDVDGLHPMNMGKLLLGIKGGFTPCTPLGIQALLHHYSIPTFQKHVVIVGRSNIVGKPLAALLIQKESQANATVTIAHSQTKNLSQITRSADILVAALGSPRFIKAGMVKEGSVVIDVGINREGGKIVGDVDFDLVSKKVEAITPVPRGIGPMTVAMLLQNTVSTLP